MVTYSDWLSKISCMVFIFLPTDLTNEDGPRLFLVILMVLLFFRMYYLLSLLTFLTTQIQIINQIIIRVVPFFFIIVFFYASTTIMMMFIDTKGTPVIEYFRDIYYWILFGGFDGGAFEQKFSVIPVIFGTVMVGILLFNILIAYLSNEFSRLEEQQVINGLKAKARMNLRIELIICFFKNGFKKINNLSDSETVKFERIRKVYNREIPEFVENTQVKQAIFVMISNYY